MSSFTFGPTPNSSDLPKPCSETKTGFGWSPFGNTNPGYGTTTSLAFGTTSTPTTVTITPGVGNTSASTGGTNAMAITINVGSDSTHSLGNTITISPSVGSTVTITPASGTSVSITQAAETTITITSNPTSGASNTPGISGASTPSSTVTAPRSTRGSFGFPTSTTPVSTQCGFGFPTSTTPTSSQNEFGFPTSTSPASTSTFSSSKAGVSSPIGKQSFPFGAQPAPIAGNNASRQSISGSHQGRGSRVVPYTASFNAESNGSIKIHSISAMPIHDRKCHEELRWEDYQLGDKGEAVPPSGSSKQTTQSILQKEKHAFFCPFGCPFTQTSSSTFDASTSSPCAERSTSLSAQPRPFVQPSSYPFSSQPSPSPFGPQPSPSPFASSSSFSAIGTQPSPSPFGRIGAQPSIGPFDGIGSPFGRIGAQPSIGPFDGIGAQLCSSTFGMQPSHSPFSFRPPSGSFGALCSSSTSGPPPSSIRFGADIGSSNSVASSSFGQTSSPNLSFNAFTASSGDS